MKVWRTLAIVPLATLLLAGPAAAYQDETDGTNPRVVSPEECVAEPRAADQIAGLLGLSGEGVTPPALPTITAPLGENLDSETSVSVKEAAREIIACFNAGDIARASALMTDNGVIRTYWQLTETPELRSTAQERIATATPRPEPAQIRLVTVTDISRLPDGRATAFVVINDPAAPQMGPETLLFYFLNQDGAWLLDDWVDFSIAAVPASTPAP
ncbi:MAG: hypothetical protein KC442_03000 [Thermomicrobiales bacterium]|nr:hypothetical protein [Thermomicrobiales bacterium]